MATALHFVFEFYYCVGFTATAGFQRRLKDELEMCSSVGVDRSSRRTGRRGRAGAGRTRAVAAGEVDALGGAGTHRMALTLWWVVAYWPWLETALEIISE